MKLGTILLLGCLLALPVQADVIGAAEHPMDMYGNKEVHKVALKTGDLVTVQISEAVGTKADMTISDSDQSTNSSTNGGGFLGPLPTVNNTGGTSRTVDNGSSQTQTITTTMTVRVTSLDSNGNAVLDGTKLLLAGTRKVTLSLHGVVRLRDIGADYTIKSDRMADAQLKVDGMVRQSPIQFITRILGIIL